MAYSTVDTDSGTATAATSVTPTVGTATTGDDVFCHVVWTNPDISLGTINDWTQVTGTLVSGPEYASAVFHHTLTGTDTLGINWTGSSDLTWQVLACGGLTATPVDSATTSQTSSTAVLDRLTALPTSVHVVCFAGAVNVANKVTTAATPDVGFVTSEGTQFPAAGLPALWTGQFSGPLPDVSETLRAGVYWDPPPSHSVGHSVAVTVA